MPEAAGSSLSRLFNNVTKYIGTGDKKIKSFAAVAGVSVQQFSDLFRKDAAGAMELFLKKLGGLDRFKASKALKAAGITNVRDINAVLLLSQNYDILKKQVDLSTEAWRKNTDLQETAAKRFSSVQSKLTEFWDTLKRSAIVMANEFLPALGRSIDRLKALLSLPSTDNDLKNLGQDIARFLDNINWQQVIDGAKTFFGYVRDIAGILSHVPVQIAAAVAAFAGLNKLSGGLIGAGIGDIVGGIGGAVGRGLFSKIPVLGALAATPVYVTNWPGGLGGLGGLGGAGGAGGGALGGLLSASAITAIGISLLPVAAALIAMQSVTAESARSARQTTAAARGLDPNRVPTGVPPRAGGTTQAIVHIDPRNLSEGNRELVDKVATLRDRQEATRIALDTRLGAVRGAIVSSSRDETSRLAQAIRANRPIVHVSVPVYVEKGDAGNRVTTGQTVTTVGGGGARKG
jgi:hypothetical protein